MNEKDRKILENLRAPLTEEERKRDEAELAKIWPKMTEDEARQILREFMERPLKGKEWPKVWIGDVIEHDYTGYSFQATYYEEGYILGSFWQSWGVDAKTHECKIALM